MNTYLWVALVASAAYALYRGGRLIWALLRYWALWDPYSSNFEEHDKTGRIVSDGPDPRMAARVAFWRKIGFTEEHVFPGEYVLLINPESMRKVRVYEDGPTWISNPKSGEYKKWT